MDMAVTVVGSSEEATVLNACEESSVCCRGVGSMTVNRGSGSATSHETDSDSVATSPAHLVSCTTPTSSFDAALDVATRIGIELGTHNEALCEQAKLRLFAMAAYV